MKRTVMTMWVCVVGMVLGASTTGWSLPIGTAITYQGRLTDQGSPANGEYDFIFRLYDASSDGSLLGTETEAGITVTDGYFHAELDFGSGIFEGNTRWLEIEVAPAGSGNFTPLSPRQEMTPTPYALALPGLRTRQNATSTNLIGGYSGNMVTGGVAGAVISGGGASGKSQKVTDDYGTVSGGWNNRAGNDTGTTSDAGYATVGGGSENRAVTLASTVGGGAGNQASGGYSTVSGGWQNSASGPGSATVGGGRLNTASALYATVPGGGGNAAGGTAATVAGGYQNEANGHYSFVAGRRAKANHNGAFVWADSNDADFVSTGDDQILIRASDGVGIGTTDPGEKLTVTGTIESTSGGFKFPDGTVQTTAAAGSPNPMQIALLRWYEANQNGYSLSTALYPISMAFDGDHIWVTIGSNDTVVKLRASDCSLVGTYATGDSPQGMVFDGSHIWVANYWDHNVSKLRASDGGLVGTYTTGDGPISLAFDGANIWVVNNSGYSVAKL